MMYTQNKFRIVSKKAIGRDIYSFEIHCPVVAQAAMPGQFVHIRANGFTLRRPISIAGIGETTLRIVFEIRGEGTAEIARLNEGDLIDMLAPLGHGFTLNEDFRKVVLIGGGIGNLLDRLFRGFVVDYLSLSFFPPVCNFADYCITFGAVLFIIVLFTQNGDGKKALTKDTENASDLSVSETVDSSAQIAAVTDNAHTTTDSAHTVTNSTDNADTSALENTDGEADGS